MRYLVDTNVLSETVRPGQRSPEVLRWLRAVSQLDLFLSVITLGEIRIGAELRIPDARRAMIENWLYRDLPLQFSGRILPVTEEIALEWGRLSAEGQRSGRVLPTGDGLLIATASVYGMTLATRNERHCAGRGVPVVNPWNT